jgi:cephalosporin hydroxylase
VRQAVDAAEAMGLPDDRAAQAALEAALDARDYAGAIKELIVLQRQPGADAAAIEPVLQGLYAIEFHKWYYNARVWQTTSYHGVPCRKWPADMWNYQEILWSLAPSLVIEFGTFMGGASLFFADTLRSIRPDGHGHVQVLSVDIDHRPVPAQVRARPDIEFMTCSSTAPRVRERIAELRARHPGPVFVILDSDHSQAHVRGELELLRPLLVAGDYLVVEDTNVNGHPVAPEFGPGPFEAVMEYLARYPNDYVRDERRETKFGFTFAPRGFLIRR